ncbi:MAG: HD domain-containing protein [Bacteroidetes bacterium]|nr:HD domain-containing protein [Bacteroidota bacterium]
MNENNIMQETVDYVTDLLTKEIPKEYIYHNLEHTVDTLNAAIEIAKGCQLDDEKQELVELAAWFHDTGYVFTYMDHETKSKEIAREFLSNHSYPEEKIVIIEGCIEATRMSSKPNNLIEEILCDADSYNLGRKAFSKRGANLRAEWKFALKKEYTDEEWVKETLKFLEMHEYCTPFAKGRLEPQKERNKKKLSKQLKNKGEVKKKEPKKEAKESKQPLKVEDKFKQTQRGIETMFRVSLRGHLDLSAIADNKANIMLSINAVIISIILSALLPRFNEDSWLIIPTIILLTSCVLTVIFATISTMPKITAGTFSMADIDSKRANLLFFGNFYRMKLQDFEDGINTMMADRDFLYGAMIRDFFHLGLVLAKKYKYLRVCYQVFMYGLIISVLSFVVAFVVNQPSA